MATIGAGLVGVSMASAATSPINGHANLIDKLVARFNLNKADVQKVFDENHTANQVAHQAEMKTRLDQAVKDGKLTQDQADKLIAKQQEMQTFRDSLKEKTETERQTAMKAKMDEFKQWLTDNNIPSGFGMPGLGHHGRGGPDGPNGSETTPPVEAPSTN